MQIFIAPTDSNKHHIVKHIKDSDGAKAFRSVCPRNQLHHSIVVVAVVVVEIIAVIVVVVEKEKS